MCIAVVAGMLIAGTMVATAKSASPTTAEMSIASASSSYTITCYKFSEHATARCKGEYDPNSNTLTVHGDTYRVQDNPYYGDGSKRGAYQYKAGPYFFDL